MCKIFVMTNMEKVAVTDRFLKTVQHAVCRTDNSGFGYAVLNEDGSVFGERTLQPDSFSMAVDKPASETSKLAIVSPTSNTFGKYTSKGNKAFMGHGRLSTNTVSLPNTHPYTDKGVTLIHNGVVGDAAETPIKCVTDNDTEILLRYWITGGLPAIEANVTGYYAMAVFQGKQLHIVRDNKAPLYISYCRTVHSYIIATTVTIIQEVAKKMKWSTEKPELINSNTHTTFNLNTILSHVSITPRVSEYGRYDYAASIAFGGVNSDDRDTIGIDADGCKVYSYNDDARDFRAGMSSSTLEDARELAALEKEEEEMDLVAELERMYG